MDPLPPRRWNPGFIAMRWRHVFWILPFAGIVIGLLLGFVGFKRMDVATGVVQVRPAPATDVASYMSIVESDDVLFAAIHELKLWKAWQQEFKDCLPILRSMVSCRRVPGTSLIEISVAGTGPIEAIEVCRLIIEAGRDQVAGRTSAKHQEIAEANRVAVRMIEDDLEIKRQRLSSMMQTVPPLHYAPGSPALASRNSEFIKAKNEFEEAQAALEQAMIAKITDEMQSKIAENPIIIHEGPRLAKSTTSFAPLPATIGFISGILLSVVAAYLLELLFPRKHSGTAPAAT